jgi:hypothetical protein
MRGGNHGFEKGIGAESWRFAPVAVEEDGVEYAVLHIVSRVAKYRRRCQGSQSKQRACSSS